MFSDAQTTVAVNPHGDAAPTGAERACARNRPPSASTRASRQPTRFCCAKLRIAAPPPIILRPGRQVGATSFELRSRSASTPPRGRNQGDGRRTWRCDHVPGVVRSDPALLDGRRPRVPAPRQQAGLELGDTQPQREVHPAVINLVRHHPPAQDHLAGRTRQADLLDRIQVGVPSGSRLELDAGDPVRRRRPPRGWSARRRNVRSWPPQCPHRQGSLLTPAPPRCPACRPTSTSQPTTSRPLTPTQRIGRSRRPAQKPAAG